MEKEILYTIFGVNDEGEFVRLHTLSRSYSGPWMLVKKGREILKQNALDEQAMMKTASERAGQQYDVARGIEGEEVGSTTPGSLSPAATAQLASDRDQIANTYNGIRQTAFRTLGQRGFGSAPSGFGLAANNAADLGQATQDTAAYRNAQVQTEQQRQHAASLAAGLTGTEGAQAIGAGNASTGAATALNKAGSTLGDITGAVAQVAPIVAAPFTGGASLIPMLANNALRNPFSNMGKSGSGVGGYGPSTSVPGALYS